MPALVYICIALAVVLAIGHAVDLHTTSQILKLRRGYESDPLLGWVLNSVQLSEDIKFWLLAVWKLIQTAAGFALAWIAYAYPAYALWCAALLAALCALYWVVLRRNLRILKG